MASVETSSISLGFSAPDFNLFNTLSGDMLSLDDVKSEIATVVMFICNHCPYVIHVREELVKLANEYIPKGISFIAISSNDVKNYPQDSPEKMKEIGKQLKFPFPYLYDETQDIARAYFAECTPDYSIFGQDLKCVYRGQLDGSRPNNGIPVTGVDIRNTLDFILAAEPVPKNQVPSLGCSIKWKQ